MDDEILINVRPSETRVAYVRGGTLLDLKIERKLSPTFVGSIHRGKVLRVLPGMQAAFVDIGLDRAAFLYVGDVLDPSNEEIGFYFEGDTSREDSPFEGSRKSEIEVRTPIQDLLKERQNILVQVAKDPIGTKGARITMHISLPGRFIVYLPTLKHYGISRKIESEDERNRLKELIEKVKPPGGLIVRTAGEGITEERLNSDLEYLDRLWKEVESSYKNKKRPGLIHSELDIELRALRDLLNEQVKCVFVDDEEVYSRISRFVSQLMPKFSNSIVHYTKQQPLFDLYDIDIEISRSMDRKIWLKSGGYIVIDEAEALVVIDVNTGRYVGKKDLEDTILKTNLEAVKEIAHQLRIRNCGGIVIIDLIDMEKEAHREKVLTSLEEELKSDRAKTNVVTFSELGLVEMTRKRIRPSLIKTLCDPCEYCDGKGYIKSCATVANEIFRDIERDVRRSEKKVSVVVHCHADVVDWIYGEENDTLALVESKIGGSIAFMVEPKYHLEQYENFLM